MSSVKYGLWIHYHVHAVLQDEERCLLEAARAAREAELDAQLEARRRELEALEVKKEQELIRTAQEASLREQKQLAEYEYQQQQPQSKKAAKGSVAQQPHPAANAPDTPQKPAGSSAAAGPGKGAMSATGHLESPAKSKRHSNSRADRVAGAAAVTTPAPKMSRALSANAAVGSTVQNEADHAVPRRSAVAPSAGSHAAAPRKRKDQQSSHRAAQPEQYVPQSDPQQDQHSADSLMLADFGPTPAEAYAATTPQLSTPGIIRSMSLPSQPVIVGQGAAAETVHHVSPSVSPAGADDSSRVPLTPVTPEPSFTSGPSVSMSHTPGPCSQDEVVMMPGTGSSANHAFHVGQPQSDSIGQPVAHQTSEGFQGNGGVPRTGMAAFDPFGDNLLHKALMGYESIGASTLASYPMSVSLGLPATSTSPEQLGCHGLADMGSPLLGTSPTDAKHIQSIMSLLDTDVSSPTAAAPSANLHHQQQHHASMNSRSSSGRSGLSANKPLHSISAPNLAAASHAAASQGFSASSVHTSNGFGSSGIRPSAAVYSSWGLSPAQSGELTAGMLPGASSDMGSLLMGRAPTPVRSSAMTTNGWPTAVSAPSLPPAHNRVPARPNTHLATSAQRQQMQHTQMLLERGFASGMHRQHSDLSAGLDQQSGRSMGLSPSYPHHMATAAAAGAASAAVTKTHVSLPKQQEALASTALLGDASGLTPSLPAPHTFGWPSDGGGTGWAAARLAAHQATARAQRLNAVMAMPGGAHGGHAHLPATQQQQLAAVQRSWTQQQQHQHMQQMHATAGHRHPSQLGYHLSDPALHQWAAQGFTGTSVPPWS